jgi:hypothetical protein
MILQFKLKIIFNQIRKNGIFVAIYQTAKINQRFKCINLWEYITRSTNLTKNKFISLKE